MSTLGERDELVRRAKGWTEADLRKFPTATLELIDSLAAALVAEGPGAAPLVGAANPIYWEGYNAALDEWELRAAAAPSLHKEQRAPDFEPLLQDLTHTRSCPMLNPNEDFCTCGLEWRIRLRTEMEMHNAWRKRAEEAEAALHKEGAGGAPTPCSKHGYFAGVPCQVCAFEAAGRAASPAGRAEQERKP